MSRASRLPETRGPMDPRRTSNGLRVSLRITHSARLYLSLSLFSKGYCTYLQVFWHRLPRSMFHLLCLKKHAPSVSKLSKVQSPICCALQVVRPSPFFKPTKARAFLRFKPRLKMTQARALWKKMIEGDKREHTP